MGMSCSMILQLLCLLFDQILLIWCHDQFYRPDFKGEWPRRNDKVFVNGDILLGGLMMIHSREVDPIHCGPVMPQGGIQALEAMLFTIDYVNKHNIIPHTSLGAVIFDDCDKDTYGLQKAVNFIKGNIDSLDVEEENYECYLKGTGGPFGEIMKRKRQVKPVSGVVAASSSVTSIQVANLLKLFKIPQVSFFSTSAELNNTERFPFFFRTIPSDEFQVKAMVDLIRGFNWTYVSVVYEESSYGHVAYDTLERMLKSYNICIAARAKLPKDSTVAEMKEYVKITDILLKAAKAKGVVIYGSDQEVRGLMRAITEMGKIGQFTWIGSDGWSARELVYKGGYEDAVLGTISVQPMAFAIPGFDKYFESLTVENNVRNPWFYEFWEKEFKCRYRGYADTPNNDFPNFCTGKENINHTYNYEKQLQFVSDAVLVFAYSLGNYLIERCPSQRKTCIARQYPTPMSGVTKRINGTHLRNIIQRVRFRSLAGQNFSFLGNGAQPRYKIIHFRHHPRSHRPEWRTVGNYTESGLKIRSKVLRFYSNNMSSTVVPSSVCADKCPPGYRTIGSNQGDHCCWTCDECSYRHYLYNKTSCKKCPQGTITDAQKTKCIAVMIERVNILSLQAYIIICLAVALLGTNLTIIIMAVFLRFNSTPVVKASGRELSYVIILGLFMCFGMTPLMLLKPSVAICALQRIFSGFCFTVVYAAILTKTNRIARIFREGRRTRRRPVFISPYSQVIICSIVASFQVLIVGAWLYIVPPQDIYIHPTPETTQHVCAEAVSYSYLISYAYPICLCIMCTLYACQTRRIPEAFNESQYIGGAVYTTCIIWIAFVPIYFAVKDNMTIRITSVCISTSLTAIVCQICLFLPKLYIILFRPERNVRSSMTANARATSFASSGKMPKEVNSHVPNMRGDSSSYGSDDGLLEPAKAPVAADVQNNSTAVIKQDSSGSLYKQISRATQTAPMKQFSVLDADSNDNIGQIFGDIQL